jgi:hypothetical protein
MANPQKPLERERERDLVQGGRVGDEEAFKKGGKGLGVRGREREREI